MSEPVHVTAVLKGAGLVDTTWFTEEMRDRGSALHLATCYLDQNQLDRSSVDPCIVGRLAQYERFISECRPDILAVEERVEYPAFGYCGTLDRRLVIGGREGILDIKGPSEADWHAIQLAGYAFTFQRPLARWNLYIFPDRYRLIERKDRRDFEVWKAALTIAQWRNGHA